MDCVLMVAMSRLNEILSELRKSQNLNACAIFTKEGIPVAWSISDDFDIEQFGAITATIMGVSEVVYSSLRRGAPEKVIIESKNHTLLVAGIGHNALLMYAPESEIDTKNLIDKMNEFVPRVEEVLVHKEYQDWLDRTKL